MPGHCQTYSLRTDNIAICGKRFGQTPGLPQPENITGLCCFFFVVFLWSSFFVVGVVRFARAFSVLALGGFRSVVLLMVAKPSRYNEAYFFILLCAFFLILYCQFLCLECFKYDSILLILNIFFMF